MGIWNLEIFILLLYLQTFFFLIDSNHRHHRRNHNHAHRPSAEELQLLNDLEFSDNDDIAYELNNDKDREMVKFRKSDIRKCLSEKK